MHVIYDIGEVTAKTFEKGVTARSWEELSQMIYSTYQVKYRNGNAWSLLIPESQGKGFIKPKKGKEGFDHFWSLNCTIGGQNLGKTASLLYFPSNES